MDAVVSKLCKIYAVLGRHLLNDFGCQKLEVIAASETRISGTCTVSSIFRDYEIIVVSGVALVAVSVVV